MSRLPVTGASYMHITKDGKCAFCGSALKKCALEGCERWFHSVRKDHLYCSGKCRTRKARGKE